MCCYQMIQKIWYWEPRHCYGLKQILVLLWNRVHWLLKRNCGRLFPLWGKRKAPAYDDLTVEIWIKTWPIARHKVLDIFNRCLQQGRFPFTWKIGVVRILYKGADKDPQNPKSSRPLTFLLVWEKYWQYSIGTPWGRRQTAWKAVWVQTWEGKVLDKVKSSAGNYILAAFLDIAGAFYNAWWPQIRLFS